MRNSILSFIIIISSCFKIPKKSLAFKWNNLRKFETDEINV